MADTFTTIVDTLRGRILRAVQVGALQAGDRLPSAREIATEFATDFRSVVSAYRELESEGLVQMRPRSGAYVAARVNGAGGMAPPPDAWIAEVLTQGLAREIPGVELHEWLRRCTETLRLRAVAISSTEDQTYGLCRELRDDFGFESEGVTVEKVQASGTIPLPIRRADLLVTTSAHGSLVRALGVELRKRVMVVTLRPDLLSGEWALLLRRPVYAVVATEEFGDMLRRFFASVPGVENLRILVLGRDDVDVIPDDAPTYMTQRVRAQLRDASIPVRGRILPPARTISHESARELFAFLVSANLETMARRE